MKRTILLTAATAAAIALSACSGGVQQPRPTSVLGTPAVGIIATGGSTPQYSQPRLAHGLGGDGNGCPTGCMVVSRGILLRFGPFTVDDYQETEPFVLTQEMRIGLIDGWMGTDAGAAFEANAILEIQYPDGSYEPPFYLQNDKHVDVTGHVRQQWPVHRTLPAGTKFVLYHSPGYVVPVPPPGVTPKPSSLHGDALFTLYAE